MPSNAFIPLQSPAGSQNPGPSRLGDELGLKAAEGSWGKRGDGWERKINMEKENFLESKNLAL